MRERGRMVALNTYTSTRTNPIAFLREAYNLYQFKSGDIPSQVRGTIAYMNRFELRLKEATGISLGDLKILNIGPGQTPREMVYLGVKNDVTGIDLDVIPQSFTPATYLAMLRQNGMMRTVKTLARKSLGIDARFLKELKRQLGISSLPQLTYRQMDATQMDFPDASFDLTYSFSVFEHLPAPAKVMDETVRVLKPGGGCYISLHLYTSENGCHDVRIFSDDREGIPYWSHLRPQHEALIQPNAYMNKLSIAEWKKIFSEKMPGVEFQLDGHEGERAEFLKSELQSLRKAGELAEYSDDDLLQVNLIAVWRKPW
jgi:SAM-dependent methyltransferase